MKNIKYMLIIALVLILLACNTESDCLSPYNDCNCPEGYEGNNCNSKATTKFVGNYNLEFSQSGSTGSSMLVTDSISQVKIVYFKNFTVNADIKGSFYGIVDGEHITVPKQKPTNSLYISEGEGEVCLAKTGTQTSLIMKLTLSIFGKVASYRVVYIKT